MNYKIIHDSIYSSIEETDREVDEIVVFATLTKAKKALINSHRQNINDFQNAIKWVKRITKNNLQPE
jgi:hypothetical protein